MLSPLKAALADRLRRFIRERDGNIAMIFGLCAIPVIVGSGIAIDVGRAYMVKLELESALDSAGLAVASSTGLTSAQLQTRLQKYFDANYPAMSKTTNLQVTMTDPTQPVINITASVDLPTTFLQLINFSQIPVSASNQVTRGTNALELALVLDNTGSMMCGDAFPNGCNTPSHISALKTDAQQIVDTLFADSVDPTKLKISVVPYVTAVNVGPALCSGPKSCTDIATDCAGNFITDGANSPVDNPGNDPIYNPSTAVAAPTATFTGNVSNGSTTISNVSPNPSSLPAGIPITGTGIASNTTVASVTATTITLSKSATSSHSGDTLKIIGIFGTWSTSSNTVTIVYPPAGSIAALVGGEVITGTGIGTSGLYPASDSVNTVSGSTVTLCHNPTQAAATPTLLTLYPAITFDTTQSATSGQWKGCVVEPTLSGEDGSGNGPDFTEPAGGWTKASMGNVWWPYFWNSGTDSSFNGWDGTSDNTWYIPSKNPAQSVQYEEIDGNVGTATTDSYGPNLSCPTPLVRLSNSQAALDSTMQNMTAWGNSGTAITVGMIWGWRTISPNPPFADGQPYGTPSLIKAVVLETDGDAEVGGNTQNNTADFTGYGYISESKLGSSNSGMYEPYGAPANGTANYYLGQRLTDVCNNMKAAGIVIYTIGLGIGAQNQQLASCAGPTGEGKFYPAPTAADLQSAFQQIAVSLNSLRLSK
jgi:Flp pilus assembly protein TadG